MRIDRCPNCNAHAAPAAARCQSCGQPRQRMPRSFVGGVAMSTLILFNITILILAYAARDRIGIYSVPNISGMFSQLSLSPWLSFLLTTWTVGTCILGLWAFLTRSKMRTF